MREVKSTTHRSNFNFLSTVILIARVYAMVFCHRHCFEGYEASKLRKKNRENEDKLFKGLGSIPVEGIDVCKCIVPLRFGDTLNSRRAAIPLVWLVELEESWDAPDNLQGVLPQKLGESKPNHTVICMVLKTAASDRRTNSHLP
ncbi:uncharacterized protein TNCV_5040831 [Trichonephila clavipes]|nr:uncharacterized protein TNCV_5040831 [Trichonephila clavipes]